jgi:hypothetical protein
MAASGGTHKYKNRLTTSYPDSLYREVYALALSMGVSIQDIQRKAIEYYVEHKKKAEHL